MSLIIYGGTTIIDEFEQGELKPTEWIGSSKEDLKGFPDEVRYQTGFALFQAQCGIRHRYAKPLKGFGSGILEIVSRHDRNTYRTVYAVRFQGAAYVLHAFQKKSTKGVATPRREINVVQVRLKSAEQHYRDKYGQE